MVKKVIKITDIIIPSDYTLEETGITQSLLAKYLNCPRSFLLAVNRWESFIPSGNTALGSVAHDVLDKLYHGAKQSTISIEMAIRKCKAMKEAGIKTDEAEKKNALLLAMLLGYVKFYAKDFTEMKFKEIERTFSVPFCGVMLRGKKDAVFTAKDGSRWILEHKTKSRISEDTLLLKLSIDLQNQFYLLADAQENALKYASGILYNVFRVPEVKKFEKPKEVYEYVSSLIAKEPDHYYKRWEVSFAVENTKQFASELREVLGNLMSRIDRAKKMPKETLTTFFRNPCACEAPFTCPYLTACAAGNLSGYKQKERLFSELDE